jgi:hypothetical protein
VRSCLHRELLLVLLRKRFQKENKHNTILTRQ